MGTFRGARGKTYFRSPSLAVSAARRQKPGTCVDKFGKPLCGVTRVCTILGDMTCQGFV